MISFSFHARNVGSAGTARNGRFYIGSTKTKAVIGFIEISGSVWLTGKMFE